MKLLPFKNKTAAEVATLSGQGFPKVCAYVNTYSGEEPTWGVYGTPSGLMYITRSGTSLATSSKASGIVFIP